MTRTQAAMERAGALNRAEAELNTALAALSRAAYAMSADKRRRDAIDTAHMVTVTALGLIQTQTP